MSIRFFEQNDAPVKIQAEMVGQVFFNKPGRVKDVVNYLSEQKEAQKVSLNDSEKPSTGPSS